MSLPMLHRQSLGAVIAVALVIAVERLAADGRESLGGVVLQ